MLTRYPVRHYQATAYAFSRDVLHCHRSASWMRLVGMPGRGGSLTASASA